MLASVATIIGVALGLECGDASEGMGNDGIRIENGASANVLHAPAHKNAAITCAIIDLARRLSLHVVAEGVETVEQRRFLLNNACTEMQGYLFAKPLPAEKMLEVLKAGGFDLSSFNESPRSDPALPVGTNLNRPTRRAIA